MLKLLLALSLLCAACGVGDSDVTEKQSLFGDKNVDCQAAKFDYCVNEMGLDETTCKKKVAAWCSESDSAEKK